MIAGYIQPKGGGGGTTVVASGTIGPEAVVSGVPASGAVTGQAGGGYFVIASGTIGSFDIGSGAIVSGRIASGQIGSRHIASGQLTGFELGSGAIVSGRIASGQIGGFHIANGGILSGNLASGNVARQHIASGVLQGAIQLIMDGGGAVLTAGEKGQVMVPYACTINWVNLYANQSGQVAVGIYKDSYCVDVETEALTKKGWKRWNEIDLTDELLAYDAGLNLTVWQNPTGKFVDENYDGPMVCIGSDRSRINALVTPNHHWPVVRIFGRTENRTLVERIQTREFPKKGLLLRSAKHKCPDISKYPDALVRLAAWYFTEGSSRKNGRLLCVVQSERVNRENCESIREDLAAMGATWSDGNCATGKPPKEKGSGRGTVRRRGLWVRETEREDGCVRFALSGEGTDWLTSLFEEEDNKVPRMDFLSSLTRDQLVQFVEVCLLGDGWANGNVFTQHDSRRMDAFMVAAVLAGFSPSLDSTGTTCSLRRNRPYTWIKDTPRTEETYKGVIWCPTLPSGYWVARRNGKVFITGNSNFPPTSGDTITTSGVPIISGSWNNQYSGTAALSGWTTALAKGDVIGFSVISVSNCQRVTVALQVDPS